MEQGVHTIGQLLRAARACIEAADAEHLLADVLQQPRAWLFAHADDVVDVQARSMFSALVQRRAAGEPVAYLTGHVGFWTLDLQVTPAVLIPRADTEVLVEAALQRLPMNAGLRVADLGTGSGAIALAIAIERPCIEMVAVDASTAALQVARDNAARLHLGNVTFREGDWCAALGEDRFDLIVSNPPYIAQDDPHLRSGDLRHEPLPALVSGRDGLDAIRTIVNCAPAHLDVGGWLLLEHGWQQGAAVRELLQRADFADVATLLDLESRERVTLGHRS